MGGGIGYWPQSSVERRSREKWVQTAPQEPKSQELCLAADACKTKVNSTLCGDWSLETGLSSVETGEETRVTSLLARLDCPSQENGV